MKTNMMPLIIWQQKQLPIDSGAYVKHTIAPTRLPQTGEKAPCTVPIGASKEPSARGEKSAAGSKPDPTQYNPFTSVLLAKGVQGNTGKTCAHCSKLLIQKTRPPKYCSTQCRVRAWRLREKQKAAE